jgi:hypothetical protein
MTDDKTQVETDELRAWTGGTRHRANLVADIAEALAGLHLGPDSLGAISRGYVGDYQAKVQDLADKVGNTAEYLDIDANDASAVADSFDENEQTQADRFSKGGGHV